MSITFKVFLTKLGEGGGKVFSKLLDKPKSLGLYSTAFTSESFDQDNNYEFLRGLGEMTLQQVIVQYIIETYPNIFTPEKKAIVTDMKKFLVQGDFFIDYLKKIGGSSYIKFLGSSSGSIHTDPSDRILLEVFQAFLGATERLLSHNREIGYKTCYLIVKDILSKNPLPEISYEILVDPKTILKEMIDRKIPRLGYIQYKDEKLEGVYTSEGIFTELGGSTFYVKILRGGDVIGEGWSREKSSAEKQAARRAITKLRSLNIVYELPPHYLNKSTYLPKRSLALQRPEEFYYLISKILQMGTPGGIGVVLDNNDKNMFSDAFTHSSFDSFYNYEVLETLGDNIVNKCIVWYLSERFPQINCPAGKEISSKLKISLVNWKSYSDFAKELGFSPYILWDGKGPGGNLINIGKLEEDVFESFFGVISYIIDMSFGVGSGYNVCYNIMRKLLDTRNISLRYEDIVDPKTQLKEIFDQDAVRKEFGPLSYTTRNLPNFYAVKEIKTLEGVIGSSSSFNVNIPNMKEIIKNKDVEAALDALKFLSKRSIVPSNSKKFEKFC